VRSSPRCADGAAEAAASGDCNVLAAQSLIDGDSKIATHLDPVFILIGPGTKIKTDRSGDEANNVGLGCRFFRDTGLIGGYTLQYFDYMLRSRASCQR
jgi:hypothetical protein